MSEDKEPTIGDRAEEAVERIKEVAEKGLEVVKKLDKAMDVAEPHLDKVMPHVQAVVGAAIPGSGLAFEAAKTVKNTMKPLVKSVIGVSSADEWESHAPEGEEGWEALSVETNEKLSQTVITSRLAVPGGFLYRVLLSSEHTSDPCLSVTFVPVESEGEPRVLTEGV